MRPFLLVFTRRFLVPCGALASNTLVASVSNVNDQKPQPLLKSIRRTFSTLFMGGKG